MAEKAPEQIISEIRSAIETSSKGQKKLYVKSLFSAFGYTQRTQDRSVEITEQLLKWDILIYPPIVKSDDQEWATDRDDWVVLSIVNPEPENIQTERMRFMPPAGWNDDNWFTRLPEKVYHTEREVENKFIIPLLSKLGYSEDDRADGWQFRGYQGSKKIRMEADFVLFDGERTNDNSLMVVEAKHTDRKLSECIGQVKSYAMWLGTNFYMLTNGNEIEVYWMKSVHQADVKLFSTTRNKLIDDFPKLYGMVSKPATVDYNIRKREVDNVPLAPSVS